MRQHLRQRFWWLTGSEQWAPFQVAQAVFNNPFNRLDVFVGSGRATFMEKVIERRVGFVHQIPSPTINTSYHIYVHYGDWFFHNTTGHIIPGTVRLGVVAVGPTLNDLTITDVRGQLPGAAAAALAVRPVFTGTTFSDQPAFGAEFLSATGWTSVGWTGSWATGWTNVPGNTAALTQATPAVIGTPYQIAYTVTGRTAGSFNLAFGGHTQWSVIAGGAVGPTATTTGGLSITPTADFNGTIVVSIRPITAVSAPSFTGRTSAEAVVLEMRFNTAPGTTFVGSDAGSQNTTGSGNTAVGGGALRDNTTGVNNTAVGAYALYHNNIGNTNSALGTGALLNNRTGTNNIAIGSTALNRNTGGNTNSAVGVGALHENITGNNNTVMGVSALRSNTTGGNNVAVGWNAGRFAADGVTPNAVGNNSVFVGEGARAFADAQTNEVVIGQGAVGGGSNTVTLGNAAITRTILRGVPEAANTMRLVAPRTPASAIAPGAVGEVCWDAGFIYVCIAANTWRRAALVAW